MYGETVKFLLLNFHPKNSTAIICKQFSTSSKERKKKT